MASRSTTALIVGACIVGAGFIAGLVALLIPPAPGGPGPTSSSPGEAATSARPTPTSGTTTPVATLAFPEATEAGSVPLEGPVVGDDALPTTSAPPLASAPSVAPRQARRRPLRGADRAAMTTRTTATSARTTTTATTTPTMGTSTATEAITTTVTGTATTVTTATTEPGLPRLDGVARSDLQQSGACC